MRALNDLPISILTSDWVANYYGKPPSPPLSQQMMELLQKLKWATHQDMAPLSGKSSHVLVQRSGHYIPFDRPDAVIEAVRAICRKD